MSWFKLARSANKYAQARAQAAFDEHADPKVQLEQAIGALQEHHQELTEAASHVIAQHKQAMMRLSTLSAQEATLAKNAQSAMATGHQDAARAFALQLAGVREQIQTLTAQLPQLEDAANQAKVAVQESADQLQAKMNDRGQILAQIDQARMQQELNASLKAVSDLTGSDDVPSFDSIKDKVRTQFAEASASAELHAGDPAVLEMQAHHEALTAQADAILAELGSGSIQPAALQAPPEAPATSQGA